MKYRDIFDALSQSLFKLAMKPRDTTTDFAGPQPLQLIIEPQSPASNQATYTRDRHRAPESSDRRRDSESTMSQLVTEAVKDAFIAVEEEAPGQGWRMMWNEMVTSNETPTLRPSDLDISSNGLFDANWLASQGSAMYAIDPFQDTAMQSGNGAMLNQDQWNLSGYR